MFASSESPLKKRRMPLQTVISSLRRANLAVRASKMEKLRALMKKVLHNK